MAFRPIQHLQSVASVPKPEPVSLAPLMTVPIGEHFRITPTGLEVHGEPSFELCENFGELLRTMENSIQFARGDFQNYMEARFGEQAAQALDASSGWASSTCRAYRWVSERVAPEDRRIDQGLSFKHHMVVAALPPAQQRKWLDKAIGNGESEPWTVSRLTAALKVGADLPQTKWYVLVECRSEAKQQALLKKLELDGHQCKAVAGRK